ncbi:hypothetical protein [Chryseobacterium sp. MEBOG07]|nr:hypothetical protein [Chryseobacterium sp. MEBOG07]
MKTTIKEQAPYPLKDLGTYGLITTLFCSSITRKNQKTNKPIDN